MKNLLLQIATQLFTLLKPMLVDEIRKLLPELVAAVKGELPELTKAAADEIEKQMPTIVHAVVVAITTTLASTATNAVDKVTDIIPGQVDDAIIDPIMAQIRDRLGGLLR